MKHLILFTCVMFSISALALKIECRKILQGEERVYPPGPESLKKALFAQRRLQSFTQSVMNVYGAKTGIYRVCVPDEDQDQLCTGPLDPIYLITGADYISAAFRTPELFDRGYSAGTLPIKLGGDSIFLYHDKDQQKEWRLAHEALAPFFRPQFISEQYVPMLRKQAVQLADDWEKRARRRGTARINEDLEYYTLANVFTSLFGETLA